MSEKQEALRERNAELKVEYEVFNELVQALREITDDYADRFDLDSPSTNPAIKFTIKQARAVLLKYQQTKGK